MTGDLIQIAPVPPSSHAIRSDSFAAAAELEKALRSRVSGEVRFDQGSRALYATDASNYRQIPIGLVIPQSAEDVIATVATCREFDAPVLSRGGGTSLAGQCCNVAVIMDHSKYFNRILELDPDRRFARVEPGIVLDNLRDAAEQFNLTFAPDPATHSRCTIGGMLGNNSCGVHALMGGKTVDNTEELDILLYDGTRMTVGATTDEELEKIIREGGRKGEIYRGLRDLRDRYAALIRERYPTIPRRVSGYNLDDLLPENGFNVARALVGSEGTLVTVLGAKLRLMPSPQFRTLVVLAFEDAYIAADHVPEILKSNPIGLEGLDERLIEDIRRKGKHLKQLQLFPQGGGFLIVEFGADSQEDVDRKAKEFAAQVRQMNAALEVRVYRDSKDKDAVWAVRESALGATAIVPGRPMAWEGWEDAAVPPERLGEYLRKLNTLMQRYGYNTALYGHFGQGCVHMRLNFDLEHAEGIQHYRRFVDEAADLVVSLGGSLSGEHGDGQARGALLPKMFGNELMEAFSEFKAVWDPTNRMNPHKLIHANQPDANLRLGADYHPWEPETKFRFVHDDGSFAHAVTRCVGVGACRRHSGGTMCPSYMVTREEKHSTRGRAHLLWEMLQGQVIKDGWKSEAVKEALDLCLSCKGCSAQCPVEVDLPTYKAEFMAHYYEGRRRPLHAYAFGYIDRWALMAEFSPRLANLFSTLQSTSRLGKKLLGVAPQRTIPKFAHQSFRRWADRQRLNERNIGRPEVVLWPDTFNNFFHPDTARAAVTVLERAGFAVRIPERHVCCGRPLYDFGFLDEARRYLYRTFDVMRPFLAKGTPIVVLEPSCASVFRDEMLNMVPDADLVRRMYDQTFLLSEFLQQKAPDYQPPKFMRKALVHGHCHHKTVLKMDDELALLKAMHLDFEMPETGCCGMAGPFGFEADKYDVSVACGERVLLPSVRKMSDHDLIITDGFSCREQIEQQTGRRALHLAEVLERVGSSNL
jgi:FAD/FMN-containing dehydrogenase/Fe-S oxidoreductase